MKRLNRIICVLLSLSFCFGALCCMSACVEEEGDSNLFYVNYKDIRIELGKNAEDVLEKLGEPKDRVNHGNCGGIGVQTEYVYSDISLYTIKQSDGEIIHKIFFKNDFVF